MSTLTIRQVKDQTYERLQARAAKHGRSVEAEVRAILDAVVDTPQENLLLAVHDAMRKVDLPLVGRTDMPREVDLP